MVKNRMTNQRLKILEYLQATHSHPTAEKVYRNVKESLPTITLATVYRNLNLLASRGDILRITINNEYRYDINNECHQHFVCSNCSRIFDICNKEINALVKERIDSDSFSVESIKVIVRGKCKDCER